jgi:DNA-binding XRE family transcriptional regulator
MGKNFDEWLASIPEGRRNRIEKEAEKLIEEYQTLVDLRKARDLTQSKLAKDLSISQVSVARMEKRTDLLISTVRSYVEAMGGQLDLVVSFPGKKPVILKGLSDAASDL